MFRRKRPKNSGDNDGNGNKRDDLGTYRLFTEREFRNPENAETYLQYALFLWQKGDYEKSWIELINAERILYGGHIPTQYGQQSCIDDEKLQTAVALAVNYTYLGLYVSALKNFDKALAYFSRAIFALDDYTPAYNNRARIHFRQGNYRKALDDFDKAIARSPEIPTLYGNRAMSYLVMNRLDEALADINKAIDMKNNEAIFYNNRALIHQMKKQHQQAIEDLTAAITLDTKLDVAYLSRALSWYMTGKRDDANYDLMTFHNLTGYENPGRLLVLLAENPVESYVRFSVLTHVVAKVNELLPVPEIYKPSVAISSTGFAGFNRDILDVQHPENKKIMSFLRSLGTAKPGQSVSPRFGRTWGVHPDNVLPRFWGQDSLRLLPAPCRWIVYGYATLVNPSNGVIFGIGYGQYSSYVRLPLRYHLNSDDTSKQLGDGWTPFPFNGDIAHGYLASYDYVGAL